MLVWGHTIIKNSRYSLRQLTIIKNQINSTKKYSRTQKEKQYPSLKILESKNYISKQYFQPAILILMNYIQFSRQMNQIQHNCTNIPFLSTLMNTSKRIFQTFWARSNVARLTGDALRNFARRCYSKGTKNTYLLGSSDYSAKMAST